MNDGAAMGAAIFDAVASGYDNAALRFVSFCADAFVARINPSRAPRSWMWRRAPAQSRCRSRRRWVRAAA